MRFFWTLFWSFLLSQMLVYVISSMQGSSYDFNTGIIIAIAMSIAVFILGGAGVPDESH